MNEKLHQQQKEHQRAHAILESKKAGLAAPMTAAQEKVPQSKQRLCIHELMGRPAVIS